MNAPEERRESELLGVGAVQQRLDEVARVLVENLALVVVLLDQVVELLVLIVEEHGVLVDVLQEVLVGGFPVLVELDLAVRVVQVQHRVQRVIVRFAGQRVRAGGYRLCSDGWWHVCSFQKFSEPRADGFHVVRGSHQFEAVKVGDAALAGDHVARVGEFGAEVVVAARR